VTAAVGLTPDVGPHWLAPLVENVGRVPEAYRGRLPRELLAALSAAGGVVNATRSGRDAAVLVLFSGESADEADLLLTVRAGTLRHHAGQAAFPGGGVEAGDSGPVSTALREAQEETGLDPSKLHHVAAKCGVFAETDIVNLVKSGIPSEEILCSLADAIVLRQLGEESGDPVGFQADQALVRLDQAVELDPENIEARLLRGRANLMLHRLPDAIADLRAATARMPDHPDAHYYLALALEADNKRADAIRSADQALRLAPDSAGVRDLSIRLRR